MAQTTKADFAAFPHAHCPEVGGASVPQTGQQPLPEALVVSMAEGGELWWIVHGSYSFCTSPHQKKSHGHIWFQDWGEGVLSHHLEEELEMVLWGKMHIY